MKHLKIILVLTLVFGIIVSTMIWHIIQLQSGLIRSNALETARLYSVALTQFRTLYTSEVVERARAGGLEISHDYLTRSDTIPLPATLSMMLGERIGEQESGARSRLYSPYPYPHRARSVGSAFDLDAWDFLSENPDEAFYRFVKQDNEAILRYATADVMRAECVDCHNTHPLSPKTDWQVGDVRGVLEINLPLTSIIAHTNSELRKTSIAYVMVGLGIAIVIGIVFNNLRQQSWRLTRLVSERTAKLKREMVERNRAMAALAKSEQRNRLLLKSVGEGIYGLDLDGKTTFVNDAVCQLLGYEESELLGQPLHALIHHSYPDGTVYHREQCPMYAAFTDGQVHRVTDEVLWRKNGTSLPVEYTSTPMRHDDKLVGAVVIFSDLTERKKMEERFRLGIEASPAAMIMVNEEGLIVHVNDEGENLFGYSSGELLGQPIEILVPAQARHDHPAHRKEYGANASTRRMGGLDLLAQHKNGTTFPVEVRLNPITTADGVVTLCSVVDLTERKKAENTILEQARQLENANKLLSEQATTDSLTGVANRRSLIAHLEMVLKSSRRKERPMSVLMADVDRFKQYNDDLGHVAGDKALKLVAKTLRDETRGEDFVARYGGEEFAIVLAETDEDEAIAAANNIRQAIEGLSGLDRQVTISIGAATLRFRHDEPLDVAGITEFLIEQADEALYHSKENGRNRVTHFDRLATQDTGAAVRPRQVAD